MNTAKYLIGEVSKITGLSKDTIHFYMNSGLLAPDYVDENNEYRYYSRWNLWQLDIITICRKLSIPLTQIKKILSSHDNVQAGLTAVSLIYPIQLLMTAIATGTGAGINILISRMDGTGETSSQQNVVRNGFLRGVFNGLMFTVVGLLAMNGYYTMSSNQAAVREAGIAYTRIVFLLALGLFIEANCTKMLQAKGNMVIPMAAQVVGVLVNLVLDPIFIFGMFGLPAMGTVGAAIATVIGQWLAMLVVIVGVCRVYGVRRGKFCLPICGEIYKEGLASIVVQSLYTLYIVGLNLILKQPAEDAVTALGIYCKIQAFFFILPMGLQQVILPIISFNYEAKPDKRIKDTLKYSIGISCTVMLVGMAAFMLIPDKLMGIFSHEQVVLAIGTRAFRIICCNLLPAGVAMMFVVYFQGVERRKASIFVTVLRQVILLVPLAWCCDSTTSPYHLSKEV